MPRSKGIFLNAFVGLFILGLLIAGFVGVKRRTGYVPGGFEGTVRLSLHYEIGGPLTRQQIREAQVVLADPANASDLKQGRPNPQVEALRAANPRILNMVQSQVDRVGVAKVLASADPFDEILPSKFMVQVKGDSSLVSYEDDPSSGTMLTRLRKSVSYHINPLTKEYREQSGGGKPTGISVTKTGETATILGYGAQKYNVQVIAGGAPLDVVVWTTTDLKGVDARRIAWFRLPNGGGTPFNSDIEGFPLRMEVTFPAKPNDPESGGRMSMELVEAKSESLKSEIFEIPSGFMERK